jgi:glycosyltransferase involved in cell wall biosynthesis
MKVGKHKILLVTSNFFPEETGVAVYASDLANEILSSEFDVTVLTGLPHYPWWKIPEKFAHIIAGSIETDELELIRINHAVPRNAGAIDRAKLEYSFWANGRKALRNPDFQEFDLVIAIMPTVAAGLLARKVSKRSNIPGIVIFQDISSLGALQSGMPGAQFFFRIAKFLERRASKWATKIVVVSSQMETMISKLIKKTVSINVIHNYSIFESELLNRIEARNYFHYPENQFIVLHTGNIGYKQDLMNVVATAKLLESDTSIKFLIIGHGNQEEMIRLAIEDCKNIELMPFVSKSDYPRILAAADALLVNERPSLKEMSLPSKLTSYLTSGRPVIAAVAEESATRKFLSGAALVVEPGNPQALADAILRMKENSSLQTSFSELGKKFAEHNLSAKSGRAKYLNLVYEVLAKGLR